MTHEIFLLKPAFIGFLCIFLVCVFACFDYTSLGFPDGHLTAYEHWVKTYLYPLLFVGNGVFLLLFIRSLWRSKSGKLLLYLYFGFIAIICVLTYFLSTQLENGQGG